MFGFDFVSKLFGYALGYLFDVTGNYGTAVILFTVAVCIISFPLAVKKYKNEIPNLRFEARVASLKEECGKDLRRFEERKEEIAKKEGVNQFAGCMNLSLIFTFVVFGGVYSTIQRPLTNVLHISEDSVSEATGMLSDEQRKQKGTDQLDVVRSLYELRPKLTMFSQEDINRIAKLRSGFDFFGINLLNSPKSSKFFEFLWIFPLMSFVFAFLGIFVSQKIRSIPDELQGISKYAVYIPALIPVWFVYRVFAAVGMYLVVSSFINIIQTWVLDKWFSPLKRIAKSEKRDFEAFII